MAAVVVERFPLTVSTFTLLGEILVAEWLVMRNGRTRGVLAPAKPPASTSFTARWCSTNLGPFGAASYDCRPAGWWCLDLDRFGPKRFHRRDAPPRQVKVKGVSGIPITESEEHREHHRTRPETHRTIERASPHQQSPRRERTRSATKVLGHPRLGPGRPNPCGVGHFVVNTALPTIEQTCS
jgi:hypothetical protein